MGPALKTGTETLSGRPANPDQQRKFTIAGRPRAPAGSNSQSFVMSPFMWLLILGPMLLGLWAQFKVSGNYNRFSRVRLSRGLTGADVAAMVLRAANIEDVRIREIGGHLTDHYDPTNKTLCLSSEVYRTPSVASAGIAAHEAGHAIQHARAYAPLQARVALLPITNIASGASFILVMAGVFMAGSFLGNTMLLLGIAALAIIALFQIITLPV